MLKTIGCFIDGNSMQMTPKMPRPLNHLHCPLMMGRRFAHRTLKLKHRWHIVIQDSQRGCIIIPIHFERLMNHRNLAGMNHCFTHQTMQ